jgi:CcmD family protein
MKAIVWLLIVWCGSGAITGAAVGAPETAAATLVGQPPPPEEFVPIDQLPPEDRLPAAPLLIGAYLVVWIGLMGYLWSIWRRLQKVEAELTHVASRLNPRERRP